ncbi:hypothetical protein ACIOZM_31855 [Pseudomonas sp. NPDC087346]|uniref:hypothetical protein n=1 Tax=Pseudomonas sp. NPDC087346 TaxID=3364438 RepID=UPI0037F49038
MKGTFSRYDKKTGEGAITPVADTAGQGFSFAASAGEFLTAEEFKFNVPVADAGRVKIEVGASVEFDKLGVGAINLRY